MIKCIVIDDEPLAREGMKLLIDTVDTLQLVENFSNVLSADKYLNSHPVDLIFTDIQMPGINGLEYLRVRQKQTPVILTTAFPEYALEAFEFNVIDYLVKPIRADRFFKAVSKAELFLHAAASEKFLKIEEGTSDYFFVRSEKKYVKIFFRDILYVDALKDYSIIFYNNEKAIVAMNLKTLEEQLPKHPFIRISKSHFVNFDKVASFSNQEVFIGKTELPLGAQYKEAFQEKALTGKLIKRK
ncbi:MAG TPA: LytTR family DNA-binding domain-containing protein [Bacteroidia bacterium]|nr:LytTR family DNA-binding domain-containing protein [Bacteroidia bacterium]